MPADVSTELVADVPAGVLERVRGQRARIADHLDDAVARRERAYRELSASTDPVDQAVARVYRDFLLQVDEVTRSKASLLLGADATGGTVVGRVAVFDDERDLALVPWHAPEGQRLLTSPDRLLVAERDGDLAVHRLTADERLLAERIRGEMRSSARRERMADPLATLTTEQGAALTAIAAAGDDVLLTGPPGSGKSAIAIVELARTILTDPAPHELRVLFVTGTTRLAARAEALGRMLGVASITPIPQRDLLRRLDVAEADTPVAGAAGEADSTAVPHAIDTVFADLRDRLQRPVDLPHPLGTVPCDEVDAVRAVRVRAAAKAYTPTAADLSRRLIAEYEAILPGERSVQRARDAADLLRPHLTPTQLVQRALGDGGLPRTLRAVATAYARRLLTEPPRRGRTDWDLIVVDEYQRLPGIVLAMLRRGAARTVLSGDPHQAFTTLDLGTRTIDATPVSLVSSLRLPSTIGAWLDGFFREHGLAPPGIRCAVQGGEVELRRHGDATPLPEGAQVLAAASAVRGPAPRDSDSVDDAPSAGTLSPLDALGLEWPEVVLVDPERILAEHGPAGVFVAATRAIDRLTVVSA